MDIFILIFKHRTNLQVYKLPLVFKIQKFQLTHLDRDQQLLSLTEGVYADLNVALTTWDTLLLMPAL